MSSSRVRIVYLHQYYREPEENGGTRSYEFARRLASAGFDVHVVTSDGSEGAPTGWHAREREGVTVHRTGVPYSNRMPYAARIRAFLRFSVRAGLRARRLQADLIFATSTPLTIILPALIARVFRRTPQVFEVRDLWPQVPIALGVLRGRGPIVASRWLERLAYRSSARIIALSPAMKRGIVEAGTPESKVSVIPNAADVELFSLSRERGEEWLASHPELEGRPFVLYCGTIGKVNGVSYLAEVAAHALMLETDLAFVVVGDGVERETVHERAAQLGVLGENFFMYPPVAKREVPAIFSASAVTTSVVIPVGALEANSANKVFDGMAAGRPVVINHGGWQKELLEGSEAGLALPAHDHERAARELAALVADPDRLARLGRNARALAEGQFSRDVLAAQLVGVLRDVQNR